MNRTDSKWDLVKNIHHNYRYDVYTFMIGHKRFIMKNSYIWLMFVSHHEVDELD